MTIRFNTQAGGLEFHDTLEKDWILHPDRDDVAICLLPPLDTANFKFKAIPTKMFMSKEKAAEINLGPGDDLFFGGRFINSEGKQKNTPALRFGNISQMWPEPIEQRRVFGSHLQESILVEGRTISGYSGSPVFTMLMSLFLRQNGNTLPHDILHLLGIVWGYITLEHPVLDAAGRPTGANVQTNTGMMGVVPIWKLEELINSDAAKAQRLEIEEREAKGSASALTSLTTVA